MDDRALTSSPPERTIGARASTRHGALVISLDFEIHWGMRDLVAPDGPYRRNLLGVRHVVPRLLSLFAEYGVAATWATVGFLFARSREELWEYAPARKPAYRDANLSPYHEPVGRDEEDDPLHFAPTLIEQIRRAPLQEIGTHTFSHYYCLEEPHDRESFRADLESAVAIAAARGVRLRSAVFPRNQHNPLYADILREQGVVCFRGNQQGWMHRARSHSANSAATRAARLVDAYLPASGAHTFAWEAVKPENGLCNIPASHFVRPWSRWGRALEGARLRRIAADVERAARERRIVHLWWHPHNFGTQTDQNMDFLRALLDEFARCRETWGMQSLTMADTADAVLHP